jgi:prevent-host-death family protein
MATNVSVSEFRARLTELLRRAEHDHEPIIITRRGKPVFSVEPLDGGVEEHAKTGDWVARITGLFADHPEVCDEIDKVYAERKLHMPRRFEL